VTSLEEVFLRVGQQESSQQEDDLVEPIKDKELDDYSIASQTTYFNFLGNVRAMCYKRERLDRRRWKTVVVSECLTPILFVLIGILITQLRFFYDSPARKIETKMYPLPQRILMN
jgi:hypothetical protein